MIGCRFILAHALAILIITTGAHADEPRPNRQLPARQRVRNAKSYYCYYGSGRVDELTRYDVVILHTPAATPEVVKQLKEQGVVTIGYITCGEDLTMRLVGGSGAGGMASWYF